MKNLHKELNFKSKEALIKYIKHHFGILAPTPHVTNQIRSWLIPLGQKLHRENKITMSWGDCHSAKAQKYLLANTQ